MTGLGDMFRGFGNIASAMRQAQQLGDRMQEVSILCRVGITEVANCIGTSGHALHKHVVIFALLYAGGGQLWFGILVEDLFGEVELRGDETDRRSDAIATVRAGETAVELGLLSREHFYTIMEESPATVALLDDVAEERRQENLARSQAEVSV